MNIVSSEKVYPGYFPVYELLFDNGMIRQVLVSSDAVSVLLADFENKRILLVRQIRYPMMEKFNPEGNITEAVAGRFDDEKGLKARAIEEAREESGAEVSEKDIEILNFGSKLATSPGAITERTHLVYAEIKPGKLEQQEKVFGLEEEGERITRVFVSFENLENYVCEDLRTFALIQWFLRTKLKK